MGRTSDAKDRLLTAAKELILEQGYHAVGVAELCDRAQVNKGSFYHFFRTKQALATELVDTTWSPARDSLQQVVEDRDRSALERLRQLLAAVYQHHRDTRAERGCTMGCPFANLAVEMSVHDPQLRQQLSAIFEEHAGLYRQLLEQAVETGELDPENLGTGDLGLLARDLLALVEGRVLLAKTADDPGRLLGLDVSALRMLGVSPDSVPVTAPLVCSL
ncbi:MAG: TetR/AcrR family transcriptional regulator [Acidobacteriota bacterium]